jgi:DNA-binding beta-propeller fold protein YncE
MGSTMLSMKKVGSGTRFRTTQAARAVAFAMSLMATLHAVKGTGQTPGPVNPRAYPSPGHVAFAPDGATLAVSDVVSRHLFLVNVDRGSIVRSISLAGEPRDIVWSVDGQTVYVALQRPGTVIAQGLRSSPQQTLPCGPQPEALALLPKRRLLLITDTAEHAIRAVHLASGRAAGQVRVTRQPEVMAVTRNENLAAVVNRLPADAATQSQAAAVVDLVQFDPLRRVATVRLPPGSTNAAGVAVSPDDRWAYVTHNVGRTAIPTTQIEFGWINANAATVIDLKQRRRHATVFLDQPDRGAANPWGAKVTADGNTLWVALSGIHELASLNLPALHRGLGQLARTHNVGGEMRGGDPAHPLDTYVAGGENRGTGDSTSVEVMVAPQPAAYGAGLFIGGVQRRRKLPGFGPRSLDIAADGRIAVGLYFSGTVATTDNESVQVISLGPPTEPGLARRGERIFHDATLCYQNWLSCATCHPDGRADGLNWDLMNDGAFNPKNTKSLVWAARTPPMMIRGVRSDLSSAVAAGFQHIYFTETKPERVEPVVAYLEQLAPHSNPATRDNLATGKQLFLNARVGCARCHPPPLLTDLKTHDVGTGTPADRTGRFDTPTLRELWRTAPYLHDGRARTLTDVFRQFNPDDQHGRTSHLSVEQLDTLIAFLRSL